MRSRNTADLLLWTAVLLIMPLYAPRAGSPTLIPVHGFLTDSNGKPIDGTVEIVFSLYDELNADTPLWTEERSGTFSVQVDKGYFSAYLGEVTPISMDDLRSAKELYLGIRVGSDREMDRLKLGSVPYAFFAGECAKLGDLDQDSVQKRLDFSCPASKVVTGWNPDHDAPLCNDAPVSPDTATKAWVQGRGYVDYNAATRCNGENVFMNGEGVCKSIDLSDFARFEQTITAKTCMEGQALTFRSGYWDCTDLDFAPLFHNHDDRYYTKSQVDQAISGRQVSWNKLTDVPPGFQDGLDNDQLANMTCQEGQALVYSNNTWVCGQGSFLHGGGTPGYIAKFSGDNRTLAGSSIYNTGAMVGIGTTNPQKMLDVLGEVRAQDMYITDNGQDTSIKRNIYFKKDLLYSNEKSTSCTASVNCFATAHCDDANDLPISGGCYFPNGSAMSAHVAVSMPVSWDSTNDSAGWSCGGGSLGVNSTLTAIIYCIQR
ncbi:MAG: hypothetical protein GXP49_18225 [Deltaproteobacteria bacterium]|nr:hypothetical protein [Deltaproteobacteria bacterium]